MALGRQCVNKAIVVEVCRDLHLEAGGEHSSSVLAGRTFND
jgi:hypothetical protein